MKIVSIEKYFCLFCVLLVPNFSLKITFSGFGIILKTQAKNVAKARRAGDDIVGEQATATVTNWQIKVTEDKR